MNEHTAETDAPDFDRCFRSWPDRNSVRNHICIQRGPHQCSCGVCGPSVTPAACGHLDPDGRGCDR